MFTGEYLLFFKKKVKSFSRFNCKAWGITGVFGILLFETCIVEIKSNLDWAEAEALKREDLLGLKHLKLSITQLWYLRSHVRKGKCSPVTWRINNECSILKISFV